MKAAALWRDGRFQIILTPETDIEKSILALAEENVVAEFKRGDFFDCRAAYDRIEMAYTAGGFGRTERHRNRDLIIVFQEKSDE